MNIAPWEIQRANSQESLVGQPTEPLGLEGWERVRDSLAQAWDWWGEGVHLRPQPIRPTGYREYEYSEKPVALQVAESIRLRSDRRQLPTPPRIVTIDAHLGDGLFMVTASVHRFLAALVGFEEAILYEEVKHLSSPQPYQRQVTRKNGTFILFAPSGPDRYYFSNYCARINAGGYRPLGSFPSGVSLGPIYLGNASLFQAAFTGSDLSQAYLSKAGLIMTGLLKANCEEINLSEAVLLQAHLGEAILIRAQLNRASLNGATLFKANLRSADLSEATLHSAELFGADLRDSNLTNANLFAADLTNAKLHGADLTDAKLFEVRGLTQDQLSHATGNGGTTLPLWIERPAHWGENEESAETIR